MSINPYLNFAGNCEEAFEFYKSVFGGEFPYIGRYNEMPPMEDGKQMPAEFANKIMHVSLPIGNGSILMGSDVMDGFGDKHTVGNNITLSINPESKEQADTFFNKLSAGGTVKMPMEDTFWGAYFGMFADKFGINWMINFETNQGE